MLRSARVAPRRPAKLYPLLAVLVIALLAPTLSDAQNTPPDQPIRIGVKTDKNEYRQGEPIHVTVTATNPLDTDQALTFGSTLQADYAIDRGFQWSANRAFATVVTTVKIPAHTTFTFPTFAHLPSDWLVPNGPHVIRGIVTGYGEAQVTIGIGTDTPPPTPLHLSADVTPNPVAFGTPVEMSVTVTNVSNTAQSFGHDGCPVHFSIDQSWKPPIACAEYWTQVTLQPGESIRFAPPEFDYLNVGRTTSGFVLQPGLHVFDFEVPGVGTTAARLQVTGHGGTITGHAYRPDGSAFGFATIQAIAYIGPDSTNPPGNSTYIHQTTADQLGEYRFDDLPNDLYFVNARGFGDAVTWYPGVKDRSLATPLPVTEGSVTEDIDFIIDDGPPPPPPGRISGTVLGNPPPWSDACCPRPLLGAVVAALPVFDAVDDTSFVPPPDPSTGNGPPTGPPGPGYPPVPPPGQYRPVYYGFADSLGEFTIEAPFGRYKLIAFAGGHRYEWWNEKTQYDEADVYTLFAIKAEGPPTPEVRFTLDVLETTPNQPPAPAILTGVVRAVDETIVPPDPGGGGSSGGGSGGDGNGTGPRDFVPSPPTGPPIEGADVVARPLVLDPRILTFAEVQYPTRTDADGRWKLEVPPVIPYVVEARADGRDPQYYDHSGFPGFAKPVDVLQNAPVEKIDFDLYPSYRTDDRGVISGVVYRQPGGSTGESMSYPIAGARVRIRSTVPGWNEFERVVTTSETGAFRADGLPIDAAGSTTYIVSAETDIDIPTYNPDVTRWLDSTPVAPAPPGQESPVRIVMRPRGAFGSDFAVGVVRGDFANALPPIATPPWPGGNGDPSTGAPPDSSSTPWWPLIGAYLYLVPADEPDAGPVAAGVTSANGTVVIPDLAAGSYKAYADAPGFTSRWFHGADRSEAAVIHVGNSTEPILIDVALPALYDPPKPGEGTDEAAPAMVKELRNSPNPFNPQTTILYRLASSTSVSVNIFDLRGRLVRSLVDRELQSAGEQRLPWDGRDDLGRAAGAGVYFYRVWTESESRTGKMVMVR